jgi:hypothetical protein
MIAEKELFRVERKEVDLPEGTRKSNFKEYNGKSACDGLRKLYKATLVIKALSKKLGHRDPNLTGGLSETILALHTGWLIQEGNIQEANSSFDMWDDRRGLRIQAKASGTATYAPHTFSAKGGYSWEIEEEWDELHFLDMSRFDETADLYHIPNECIDMAQVAKGYTFQEKRKMGVEIKLSLMDRVIQPNNLKPYDVIDIKRLGS